MLIFFDETFRTSLKHPDVTFGALCGVAIPESQLHKVASDIYQLKYKHLGAEFARDGEIKGKDLLKNYTFAMAKKGIDSRNIALAILRSAQGLSLDSIIKTPFFAISQSQNVGLQLADFVTTIVGLRFMSHPEAAPYFEALKRCRFAYQNNAGYWANSLKIIRARS